MKLFLKNLRRISYKKNKWNDVNLKILIVDYNSFDIVKQTINFFKNSSKLIYPSKSYFVAIVYALCFETFFKMQFYEMLNDPELLFDDKFFVPYENDKETYDKILKAVDRHKIFSLKSVQKTVQYFKKEFDLTCN